MKLDSMQVKSYQIWMDSDGMIEFGLQTPQKALPDVSRSQIVSY